MNIITWVKQQCMRKHIYNLQDVFTPTTYAELSYKRRPELEQRLKSALNQPGKQVIIYGHSGSGKSTLLHNILRENGIKHFSSQCINKTTVDDLMLDAFDQLSPYYIDTLSDSKKYGISRTLKTDYLLISSSMNASYEEKHSVNQKRLLPPQLTPQRLANFIGAAGYVWIIEDFHKVNHDEKVKLAQVMKLFVDMANIYSKLKIIVVGAAETGHEVVDCESELNNRVTEIGVPLLNSTEIAQVLEFGTQLLHIQFADELKDNIVKYSNCLATVAHQIAYNICESSNIKSTQKQLIFINNTVIFDALSLFISNKENSYKQLFDKITEQRSGKYQNVSVILHAMIDLTKDEITQHEILLKIYEHEPEYPQGNLSTYLKKLCTSECDEVLRINSGKYSFTDPFFKAYISMIFGISNKIKIDIFAGALLTEYLKSKGISKETDSNLVIARDHIDSINKHEYYVYHVFDNMEDHIATLGWYGIQKDNGSIYDYILKKEIEMNVAL